MELQKEWQAEAYKIMAKYPKEEGEQEYYMYYDVDVPKMLNTMATEMLKAVEALVNSEIASLQKEHDRSNDLQNQAYINSQISAIKLLYFKLNFLKPLTDV